MSNHFEQLLSIYRTENGDVWVPLSSKLDPLDYLAAYRLIEQSNNNNKKR